MLFWNFKLKHTSQIETQILKWKYHSDMNPNLYTNQEKQNSLKLNKSYTYINVQAELSKSNFVASRKHMKKRHI